MINATKKKPSTKYDACCEVLMLDFFVNCMPHEAVMSLG